MLRITPVRSFALVTVVFSFLFIPAIGSFPLFFDDDRTVFYFVPIYDGPFLARLLNLIGHIQVREFLPVAWTFVFLEVRLFGPDPFYIRSISLALHFLASLLVWRIARRLSNRDELLSTTVAILYVILPVNMEAVLLASGQFWQLSVIFALSSTLCFLKYHATEPAPGGIFLGLSLLLFTAGILSKSGIVMLPVIFFFLLIFFYNKKIKTAVVLTLPFFAITFLSAAIVYSLSFSNFPVPAYAGGNAIQSFINHMPLFFRALWNFFLPIYLDENGLRLSLAFLYPYSIAKTWVDVIFFITLWFTGLAFLAGLWIAAGRTPAATLGLAWFLTNQAFFSGILPGQWWPLADRYLYFGSFGLILLFCLAVFRLLRNTTSRFLRFTGLTTMGLYLLILLTLAGAQRDTLLNESRAIQQNNRNLENDLALHFPEIRGGIDYSFGSLRALPLGRDISNWSTDSLQLEKVYWLAHHEDADFFRFKNQYYRALAITGIHEVRHLGIPGRAAERLLELIRSYPGNPYLALNGALYLMAIGREVEAGPLLETWKNARITQFDKLKNLASKPGISSPEVQVKFVTEGNYLLNLEILDNSWLFLELYTRYLKKHNQDSEATATESIYRKTYSNFFIEKDKSKHSQNEF